MTPSTQGSPSSRYRPVLLALLGYALLLSACGSAPTASPTTAPTTGMVLPTATLASTSTPLPPTQAPTSTPLPTDTPVPTFTPSPTPELFRPGLYKTGGCTSTPTKYFAGVSFCVNDVRINRLGQIVVDAAWTFWNTDPDVISMWKEPDKKNENIYMLDDLGRRYSHINGGGAAYNYTKIYKGEWALGWFIFPEPQSGAKSFTYYDDGYKFVIPGMKLDQPAVLYGYFSPAKGLLSLEYGSDRWQLTADGDLQVLSHVQIAGCTVGEMPDPTPQGAYKNTVTFGNWKFDLYGTNDPQNSRYIREYVLVGAVEGYSDAFKTLFRVMVPNDNSAACLDAVGTLLSTLEVK
jgi:hypothetical protein